MGKAAQSFADWRLRENLIEYDFYFKKFERLLRSLFKWNNLPKGVSQRFIEDKLFHNGLLIFYKSPKLGFYVITIATPIGFNAYEEPTAYKSITVNGLSEYVPAIDCVPIWNDMFMESNVNNVNFFAKSLSNIKKTFDINLEQLKNPYLISCPDGQRTTVQAVMNKKTNGEPYILVDDSFDQLNRVNVFDLKIQSHLKELTEAKKEVMNEGLTFFGINNVNVVKAERLVTGEANQNNEEIDLNVGFMYEAREQAVKLINERFGLNIEVEINKDIEKEIQNFMSEKVD
jgi:hypothetical protein